MIPPVRPRAPLVTLALVVVVVGCGSAHASRGRVLVLRAQTYRVTPTPATMRHALAVVKTRLHALGVKSPVAAFHGKEITVQLAGVSDQTRVAAVLSRQGWLSIYDFEGDLAAISLKSGVATPFASLRALQRQVRPFPVGGAIVEGSGAIGGGWYLFRKPPEITVRDLVRREIRSELSPVSGQPEVLLAFTHHGSMEFQRITKAEYERGQLEAGLHGAAGRFVQRYAQHSAFVLDGTLILATPFIDYTDASLSLGIAGGQAVLTEPTRRAAQDLAIVLRSGPLPVSFTARIQRGE